MNIITVNYVLTKAIRDVGDFFFESQLEVAVFPKMTLFFFFTYCFVCCSKHTL